MPLRDVSSYEEYASIVSEETLTVVAFLPLSSTGDVEMLKCFAAAKEFINVVLIADAIRDEVLEGAELGDVSDRYFLYQDGDVFNECSGIQELMDAVGEWEASYNDDDERSSENNSGMEEEEQGDEDEDEEEDDEDDDDDEDDEEDVEEGSEEEEDEEIAETVAAEEPTKESAAAMTSTPQPQASPVCSSTSMSAEEPCCESVVPVSGSSSSHALESSGEVKSVAALLHNRFVDFSDDDKQRLKRPRDINTAVQHLLSTYFQRPLPVMDG